MGWLNFLRKRFKKVKIKIVFSSFPEDIVEFDIVKVPIGLTNDQETRFIDEYVYNNWHFVYGY